MITSTKLVTFSINGNIKFLENIKQEFQRTISWNKYKSEITTQKKQMARLFDWYNSYEY